MPKGLPRQLALIAAPFALGLAGPVLAAPVSIPPADAFERTIAEAKSAMMADTATALEKSREAASLVRGNSKEAQQARLTAKWLEAEALTRLNRAQDAARILDSAISEATASFPRSRLHADLLRSKGSLNAVQGEYGVALSAFLESHEMYEALGEDRSRAIVLQNIGSLYSDARDYERVLTYYQQASAAFPEDKALALSAHNNTGNALKELGRLAEAEAEFRRALDVAASMESPLLEARILTNIASTQFLNGNSAAAEQTLRRGLAIANRAAPEWRPFLFGVRAQIAFERGDPTSAQTYLASTFDGQDLETTSPFFRDFHETAYKLFSQTGNYRLASQHLAAFHRLDGQARDLSATANNALLAARFDAANRDLEIAKLSLEKEASAARLGNAQNRVILLSVVMLIVIGAFIVVLLLLRMVNRSRREIEEANRKLTHVIQHDALTQLYARDHFRALLEEAIEHDGEAENPPVLAFIDLDRFKQVNDVFGHAVGDKLLMQVADCFRAGAGEAAIIGRLGGDEFAMILPAGTTIDEAVAVADRIIERVGEPFAIEDAEVSVGASIGLTQLDAAHSSSVHMTNADLALYAAKDRGRGNCAVYRPEMRDQMKARSSLEKDLEAALETGQFSVVYQPIVRGEDNAIIAYEALMRWNHPERGIVPPAVFIPVAEESRLIERMGAWMLRTACREAAQWPSDLRLTVNVSPHEMGDPAFLNVVAQSLAASGLEPARLVLELAETLVLEFDPQREQMLTSLRKLGVAFALDNFGRGHSSLNSIDQTNFTMIKIDRQFVQDAAAGSSRSEAVVAAIIAMARSLAIDVTAEGIENQSQADALLAMGCTSFQGYHFGRPKTAPVVKRSEASGGKSSAAA